MLKVAKQNFERNPKDQTLANKFLYYKNNIRNALKKLKNNILKILQIQFQTWNQTTQKSSGQL